jgi:hypothetical protein
MEHAANYKETVENMGRYMTDNDLTPLGTWVAVPNDYFSSQFVANFFGIWAAAFAFLALPFVLYMWIKKKDNIPILVWLGGWVCSLLEPMLDHLGHLWWSHNLAGPAMSGFHLNIPFLIPPCYCGFVAMTGYLTYLVMRNGATKKKSGWSGSYSPRQICCWKFPVAIYMHTCTTDSILSGYSTSPCSGYGLTAPGSTWSDSCCI